MTDRAFDLTLGFQLLDYALVFPADFMRQTSDGAVLKSKNVCECKLSSAVYKICSYLTPRFQVQYAQSFRRNLALDLVVWRRNAFERLQTLQSVLATMQFVRKHAYKNQIIGHGFHGAQFNGDLPRTVRKRIRLGARKWNAPRFGLMLHRFRKKSKYFTENARKISKKG